MPTVDLSWPPASGPDERTRLLGEALDSLLEFTGATAGWVGLVEGNGLLHFPVRRGDFPQAWLTYQQGAGSVWGFEVREGPTLLNALMPFPPSAGPTLTNLVSCPLGPVPGARGQVVLANKPSGFNSQDAAVLQGFAHLMARQLEAEEKRRALAPPPALAGRILEHLDEGVLVVDERGALVYVNSTWLTWTGFTLEEVRARQAPFPFWVSHHQLASPGSLGGLGDSLPANTLPFRRRDHSVFWCQVQTRVEEVEGRRMTLAFLHQAAPPAAVRPGLKRPVALPLLLDDLPQGIALTDRQGRILWANTALERLVGGNVNPGELLRDRFLGPAAGALEKLTRDPSRSDPGRTGSLLVWRNHEPLLVYWLTVGLTEGPGFLFAFTDETHGLGRADDPGQEINRPLNLPEPGWLVLQLEAGAAARFWNERWEGLTGLSAEDMEGVRSELVLDWLFPQQRDRELVADWLHQTDRRGGQVILDVLTRAGSRPLLCTFLPLTKGDKAGPAPPRWLLLVGEPELFAGVGSPSQAFVRRCAAGLGLLLDHYLSVPIGLAEIACERSDLPAEVSDWFAQILDRCQRANRLIRGLEDLATVTPGETHAAPLAALVRDFLSERRDRKGGRSYELVTDLRDEEVPVRVNRRMLRVVLQHLLGNAEDALLTSAHPQIEVRVQAQDDQVCCDIRDNGEGLPTEDWSRSLLPFFSTKGPFARDASHAALEATGLGLTVSQHLLSLMGGQLRLSSKPDEGTTVSLFLPRADRPQALERPDVPASDPVRSDAPASAPGPHSRKDWSSAREPPAK